MSTPVEFAPVKDWPALFTVMKVSPQVSIPQANGAGSRVRLNYCSLNLDKEKLTGFLSVKTKTEVTAQL